MCLWKSMKNDQMNDQMNGGENEEGRRVIIMEWLNKSIEKGKVNYYLFFNHQRE